MRYALSIVCVLWITVSVFPQQAQWAKAYSGANREVPASFIVTEDGELLVVGHSLPSVATFQDNEESWLMRISFKGMETERWYFDSLNPDAEFKEDVLEQVKILRRVEDGGYLIAGSISSEWRTGNFLNRYNCAFLAKLSEDLEFEWQRFLGDEDLRTRETINDLLVTHDGEYMAAGSTSSFGMGGKDFWLVRFDAEGEVVWQKAYGGAEDDEAQLLAQTPDGGFWVAGVTGSFPLEPEVPEEPDGSSWTRPQSSHNGSNGLDEPDSRTWILRLSAEGAVLWQRAYTWGHRDRFHAILLTEDDGCILAGETIEDWGEEVVPDTNILLVKLDGQGGMVWQRAFGGGDSERITRMIPKGEDKFLAVGDLKSGEDQELVIMQITKTGHLDWVTAFGADAVAGQVSLEHGSAVAWTEDNEILVAGATGRLGPMQDDVLLLRLTELGLIPNCDFSRVYERFPFRDLEVEIEDTQVEFTAAEVSPTVISFSLRSMPVEVVRDVCAAKKNLVRR